MMACDVADRPQSYVSIIEFCDALAERMAEQPTVLGLGQPTRRALTPRRRAWLIPIALAVCAVAGTAPLWWPSGGATPPGPATNGSNGDSVLPDPDPPKPPEPLPPPPSQTENAAALFKGEDRLTAEGWIEDKSDPEQPGDAFAPYDWDDIPDVSGFCRQGEAQLHRPMEALSSITGSIQIDPEGEEPARSGGMFLRQATGSDLVLWIERAKADGPGMLTVKLGTRSDAEQWPPTPVLSDGQPSELSFPGATELDIGLVSTGERTQFWVRESAAQGAEPSPWQPLPEQSRASEAPQLGLLVRDGRAYYNNFRRYAD